jgi:hypothetical protein
VTKIDLDELEQRCKATLGMGVERLQVNMGEGMRMITAEPRVTLALIARIRELEATVRGEIGPGPGRRNRLLREILERGAVLP